METESTSRCEYCKYDLQGIPSGSCCPECGEKQPDADRFQSGRCQEEHSFEEQQQGRLMQLINRNLTVKGLSPLPDIRKRARLWMNIAGVFVISVAFLQFLVAFAIIHSGLYHFIMILFSISWPFVVKEIMPAEVDDSMPPIYKEIRKIAALSQWCWVAGFLLWIVFVLFGSGALSDNPKTFWPLAVLHSAGGVGLIAIVFWLHDLALRMELSASAKRLSVVAWVMGTWGFIVFITEWKHVSEPGFSTLTPALLWFCVVALIFPWLYTLYLLAKSLFELASDSVWSLRYEREKDSRLEEVRKNRERLDRKQGLIGNAEVYDDGVVCKKCGYDLQGLNEGISCPECGKSSVRS